MIPVKILVMQIDGILLPFQLMLVSTSVVWHYFLPSMQIPGKDACSGKLTHPGVYETKRQFLRYVQGWKHAVSRFPVKQHL